MQFSLFKNRDCKALLTWDDFGPPCCSAPLTLALLQAMNLYTMCIARCLHITFTYIVIHTTMYCRRTSPRPLCRQWTESVRVITQFRPGDRPCYSRRRSFTFYFFLTFFFIFFKCLFWLHDIESISLIFRLIILIFSSLGQTEPAQPILGDGKEDQLLWQIINWPTIKQALKKTIEINS